MGFFGPCVNGLIPGRSKFDPDLHPDHAPSVPVERGEEYLEVVRRRVASRSASGRSLRSLKLHTRGDKAWVSMDTLHSGIAFEWGSCHQPANRILSSSARKFQKPERERTPEEKERLRKAVKTLQRDALKRLRGGLRDELRFAARGPHARDAQAIRTIRERLTRVLGEAIGPRTQSDPLPFHILERIKAPFRSTLEREATTPSRRLLARLRRAESLRDLRGLVERLTG